MLEADKAWYRKARACFDKIVDYAKSQDKDRVKKNGKFNCATP